MSDIHGFFDGVKDIKQFSNDAKCKAIIKNQPVKKADPECGKCMGTGQIDAGFKYTAKDKEGNQSTRDARAFVVCTCVR